MNWTAGVPSEHSRVYVKNLPGFDPFRIFEAVCKKTRHGVELLLTVEQKVLRGRDLQGLFYVTLGNKHVA